MEPEPESRRLHWLIAVALTVWCLCWLAQNGYNYLDLTWDLFSKLKWRSLALFINPCFVIWLGLFSSAVWAPFNLLRFPWAKHGPDFGRGSVALLVFFVPPLLGLAYNLLDLTFVRFHGVARMENRCSCGSSQSSEVKDTVDIPLSPLAAASLSIWVISQNLTIVQRVPKDPL